ncbi:hypothetical protein CEK28_11600 [Xenophilus sp. AP218F]|nr:hypothetical protein CEK28_11600 [Xenophilus sp. AP218F]
MRTLTVIGLGRLGRSVARLAAQSGGCRIAQLAGRSLPALEEARAFVGEGEPVALGGALRPADLYLLAVPDGAIAECAQRLADHVDLPAGAVAFHASGVGDAGLLAPLARRGLRVASLHPAYSFADPARAAAGFAGTLCALEGEAEACETLSAFAVDIGGRPFRLAEGGKPAYHAALSVASNYLVTLAAMAERLAAEGGVPEALLRPLLGNLMRQSLDNALALGPRAALTGPVSRGDAGTVARHLQAMRDPGLIEAYRAMGRQTMALAGERLDAEARRRLAALLG